MVVVIDRWPVAAHMLNRRRHAPFKLVVIIGIQKIVLPVVLIVHHRLKAGEPVAEKLMAFGPLGAAAIGIAAPVDIAFSKIGAGVPEFFIDQRLQTGAIGSWF